MNELRLDSRPADCLAPITGELRNDKCWWRKAPEFRPARRARRGPHGCFPRRPRLYGLTELPTQIPAWSCTTVTDAASGTGRGAAVGNRFIRGKRSGQGPLEGRALEARKDTVKGKLILARMKDGAAIAYANFGAGIPPVLPT